MAAVFKKTRDEINKIACLAASGKGNKEISEIMGGRFTTHIVKGIVGALRRIGELPPLPPQMPKVRRKDTYLKDNAPVIKDNDTKLRELLFEKKIHLRYESYDIPANNPIFGYKSPEWRSWTTRM